jgi:hypothetical protein
MNLNVLYVVLNLLRCMDWEGMAPRGLVLLCDLCHVYIGKCVEGCWAGGGSYHLLSGTERLIVHIKLAACSAHV